MNDNKEMPALEVLKQRYDDLQRRVTRFSAVEQELIDTRNRLDCELGRFGRIHAFSTRALQATSDEAFAIMVADALLDDITLIRAAATAAAATKPKNIESLVQTLYWEQVCKLRRSIAPKERGHMTDATNAI
jgi:hypothetical protein